MTEYCLTAGFLQRKQQLKWFLLPQHTNLCSYTTIKQSLKFNQNKYLKQRRADKLFRKGLNKTWKEISISCAAWELPETRNFHALPLLRFSFRKAVCTEQKGGCLNSSSQGMAQDWWHNGHHCHQQLAPLHSQQGAEDSSSCWKALTAWEYWLFRNIVMICSFFQTAFPQIAFLPSTPQPFQAPKKQTKVDVLVFIWKL